MEWNILSFCKMVFNNDGTVTGNGSFCSGKYVINGYFDHETKRLAVTQSVNPETSVYEPKCNYGWEFDVIWRLQWDEKKNKFKGKIYRNDNAFKGAGWMEIKQN